MSTTMLRGARLAHRLGVPAPVRRAVRRPVAGLMLRVERLRHPGNAVEFPDGSRRVYCHHIRKTGGTSLHRSFIQLGGEPPLDVERRLASSYIGRTVSGPYVYVTDQPRTLEYGDYFYGWSHRPAHELALPPRTFTVSILRDPVRRVLSYYEYLLEGDTDAVVFRVGQKERDLATNGFHSFLNVVPRQDLLRQLFMFSADFDVAEAVDTLARCSLVFRSERYDDGLAELSRRLTLPLSCRRDRVGARTVELPGGELDRLRVLVEPEYDMLRQLGLEE